MTEPNPEKSNGGSDQPPAESRTTRRALEVKLAARRRNRRLVMVVVPLLVVAAATTVAVRWNSGAPTSAQPAAVTGAAARPAKDCPSRPQVTVWVPPALVTALRQTASAFQTTDAAPCVTYVVQARSPIESMIGLGKGQPNRPDAWVADSSTWVDRVNATAKINASKATPFAESALVVAMDPARAATFKAAPSWQDLLASDRPIRISDPRSTTAGMLTIASALPQLNEREDRAVIPRLAKITAPSTQALFDAFDSSPADASAFPVSEADLAQHNQAEPNHQMVPVTPRGGTPSFAYSLVDVATDPAHSQAIAKLGQYLTGTAAASMFAAHGIRSTTRPVAMATPTGGVGEITLGPGPSSAQIAAATDAWQAATIDFSLLTVFDVSGSMKERIGNTTRVALTQQAAGIALAALPKSTRLGVWIFSDGIGPGGVDYREVVPFGLLTDSRHRARVAAAAAHLADDVGGGTGLYDTIWAAYQKAKASYDSSRLNAVVILTDGRDQDSIGISLTQLKANLRAHADPAKPVAITTIGIGPDVDSKGLTEISRMTSSKYYSALTPADMTTVLAKALFDHECKDGHCV
ncbi:MAG: substrate-binding and VWA domain-containing protein [Humibacillus sp.]|nr:substrate-binding and VWA domain-containing protein [Humibacillus sp.]MDN5777972.1 substrate-binding and VWA domain-containing protein [Humibacillus sp.]